MHCYCKEISFAEVLALGQFPVSHSWDNFQYHTAVIDHKKLYFLLNRYFNFSFQYDEEKEKELERSRKKKRLDALEAQWLVSSLSDSRPRW